ncbi:MAG: enterochelin esterase-like enzyme [Acidobacteria bacterium]|nr:enterochelin esterase-like enzyme [Acidobacteriota bacterium]
MPTAVAVAGAIPSAVVTEHEQDESRQSLRFRLTLSAKAEQAIADLGLETPVTGRVYVVLSRTDEREPRLQTGLTGIPLWGVDVSGFTAGDSVMIDSDDDAVIGYPLEQISAIPDGSYFVQAFLNVYTTFERSDGHVLQMHLNSGAGQSVFRAPGNAHSMVERLVVSTRSPRVVDLDISQVIPPIEPPIAGEVLQQGNPPDTERVKFVKMRSDVLSEFWGRDMYIGANVLLPAGYEADTDTYYPTIYSQGHFPGRGAPFGYREPGDDPGGVRDFWLSDEAPRMIAVSIRDANPYYDTSYSVNSANVGPYGDAIHNELIPYLEEKFRMIPETWARVLSGGSTGGWEALAMQIFYPDVYGGTWGWCPDPVDFNYYQIVNVYEDTNAYFTEYDWVKVERPNSRRPDGNVRSTVRMENLYELAVGPDSRSGGQWAIWEAVYGPVGDNGYPARIWDPLTGEVNPEVAHYWLENFDLHDYLRKNWSSIGESLRGKIHVATGEMDTYYLEEAVYLLEEFLTTVDDPPAEASFEYGRRKPHCWIGYSPEREGEDLSNVEFLRIVADHLRANQPAGTTHTAWYR